MAKSMLKNDFLMALQNEAKSFARAVATDEGQWIIKGFIDIYQNVYTISIDTKIVSKVLELLLFPMFVDFGKKYNLDIDLSPQQNFYPDMSFIDKKTNTKFAVDIKSTYRTSDTTVNGMTLGAFTGYFRNRKSTKNIRFPYSEYEGHYVLGVIYSQNKNAMDERTKFSISDLQTIPSVIHSFEFFAQPKYKIASGLPGSGNTKNIGSCTKIDQLLNGSGLFSTLGEEIYDDYWMYYLTRDMAQALEIVRPYTNLPSYLAYKKKGIDALTTHEEKIKNFDDNAIIQEDNS